MNLPGWGFFSGDGVVVCGERGVEEDYKLTAETFLTG